MLPDFDVFNVVDGLVDHEVLSVYRVDETVTRDQYFCGIGFLAWGASMIVVGWRLVRVGNWKSPSERRVR